MSDVIKITKVSKSFGTLKAVNDLSLSVPEGAIFGFLGPNGAGKSTTIRMLLGLIKPDTGKITLLGQSITTGRNSALRKVGAFVEEPDFYINLSAWQNLCLLARLTGTVDNDRIREVLDIVDLTDRADDRIKAYSRGMRQRLGIAQALLDRPQLLILDEPTSSLDPSGIRDIRQLIIHLAAEEKIT
ncbi:MAG: ATP-binding cassette domain-containing protein, partial [Candidatus Marinimicrobia bacterium]|nr:ATP-binding cassette domain-containing protein [Candidatus Neomarinimicrobiota bacterium]